MDKHKEEIKMQKKQIDCIRVGKVKARKKNWKAQVMAVAADALDSLATALTYVGIGCFLGIGFGGGLALVAALV